jgi:hypothetical protein
MTVSARALLPESALVVSILGIPVAFETKSADVLAAIRSAYEDADILPSPPLGRGPRVRVEVTPDVETIGTGELVVHLPERNRLVLRWAGGEARADAERGEALARVRPEAADGAGFRERVLDHLALFLVTHLDRHPLHAAGIEKEGRAVLLVGPSGLGKSSLTYAAMRAGWRVLADDAVYVQRAPHRTLWGLPRRIHLPPEAVRHFPELEGTPLERRPDGRLKIAAAIPASSRAHVPWTGDVACCLLSRSPAHRTPERVSWDVAAAEMRTTMQGGFGRFADSLRDCVASLGSAVGHWRLPVTAEPSELARRLDDLFGGAG